MKAVSTLLILTLISLKSFSQASFKEGYFITNKGEKVICFIKNTNWDNNPKEFTYRIGETQVIEKKSIDEVSEFSVTDVKKYQRYTVSVDTSAVILDNLTPNSKPEYKLQTVFLNVLLEGNASLYAYKNGIIKKFFFKTGSDTTLTPLVSKKYVEGEGNVRDNSTYKQQLFSFTECTAVSADKINELKYTQDDLLRLFNKYNSCGGNGTNAKTSATNYAKSQKPFGFNLWIRPGLNLGSAKLVSRAFRSGTYDLGSNPNMRIGLEGEIMLPVNQTQISLILEPSYQMYDSKKTFEGREYMLKYNTFEFSPGFRYYFNAGAKSKLFLNASYAFAFATQTAIEFTGSLGEIKKSSDNFSFGGGYNFNSKYAVELRYNTKKDLIVQHDSYTYAYYQGLSFTLAYNFL